MAPKKDPKRLPRKPQFEVGERVLCFREHLLYEAECVKVSVKYRKVKYLVHYPGGNENWDDEWVPESRLLKYSEINLQKQRELFEQEQSIKEKMAGVASRKKTSEGPQQNREENMTETDSSSAGNRAGSSSSETPQRPLPLQRGRALASADTEPYRELMRRTDFKVDIPTELKPWLVNDWNMVTRQNKLFCLPAKKNVESILEDYKLYELSNANSEDKIYAVPEVVAGIRAYFNMMLSSHLLYKFEKPQHATILANDPGIPMSYVYGAPHLLRLFVKIGGMLSHIFFDTHSTTLLLKHLHDFVKYLERNSAALFSSSDYELASPEYIQKAAEEPDDVCHS
ncbi:mortality factor 4-like protein 1 [Trichosurus vulpecula]|uniref:mortality factor 4-like protein 1 n=1 Tax=Trichosurus vulpecula TaxID=9337 RepID=UPI00186B2B42|nr:mortality factor 4-like protein 1 [Trichosurus vulpecula]